MTVGQTRRYPPSIALPYIPPVSPKPVTYQLSLAECQKRQPNFVLTLDHMRAPQVC